MSNQKITELAFKIMDLLTKHDVSYQAAIYFEGKRYSQFSKKEWLLEEGHLGSHYTEYANDDTITMTFEGDFYHVINYGVPSEALDEFTELIESYGYSYEQGNAWNLALYEM